MTEKNNEERLLALVLKMPKHDDFMIEQYRKNPEYALLRIQDEFQEPGHITCSPGTLRHRIPKIRNATPLCWFISNGFCRHTEIMFRKESYSSSGMASCFFIYAVTSEGVISFVSSYSSKRIESSSSSAQFQLIIQNLLCRTDYNALVTFFLFYVSMRSL
jgi:hypothetical protein